MTSIGVKTLEVPRSMLKVLQILAWLAAITSGCIAMYSVILPKIKLPSSYPPLEETVWWALLFQTIAIFFFLGFVLKPLPHAKSEVEFRVAVAASNQFWKCWAFLWASWFCLYVTWFVSQHFSTRTVHALGDIFNMLSAAAVVLCYLVMTVRTSPPEKYGFHQLVFWVVSSCVALALVEILFVHNSPAAVRFFHGLQGLVSGVALALLVGRLESRLMDVPRARIAALYAYAVIQFSYPVLQESKLILLVMTSAALFLKILLFWQISSVLSSGTIFWYMAEYRRIYDEGRRERADFLQKLLIL